MAGWVIVAPVLIVMLVSPYVNFGAWTDRAIAEPKDAARLVATYPRLRATFGFAVTRPAPLVERIETVIAARTARPVARQRAQAPRQRPARRAPAPAARRPALVPARPAAPDVVAPALTATPQRPPAPEKKKPPAQQPDPPQSGPPAQQPGGHPGQGHGKDKDKDKDKDKPDSGRPDSPESQGRPGNGQGNGRKP